MIEIEEAGWDSPETDGCYSMTYAVLKVNGIVIPLCEDCLRDLEEELKNYRSKIHCYECKHYVCSNSGLQYGGSCQLEANEKGKTITSQNAGYNFSHDFNYSCSRGERN